MLQCPGGKMLGKSLSMLSLVAAIGWLTACQISTPWGPFKVEPLPPTPTTTTPTPGTPGVSIPSPVDPGRNVTGYDTDGDGVPDLVYDPVRKEWYRIRAVPRNPGGGNPASAAMAAMTSSSLGGGGGEGELPPPDPEGEVDYVLDQCLLNSPPLDWAATSAEEFVDERGLNVPSGQTVDSPGLMYNHLFDSDANADITLFWSTNHAVIDPRTFSLCFAMHALPGATPSSVAGMQIRVTGAWQNVARWMLAMGVKSFSMDVAGSTWTLTSVPNTSSVLIHVNGIYSTTIQL